MPLDWRSGHFEDLNRTEMFSAENNFEKNDSVLCTAKEIMRHLGEKKKSFLVPVADHYFYNKALHL